MYQIINVNEEWSVIETIMKQGREKIVAPKQKQKKQNWWDGEYVGETEERNKLRLTFLQA